MFKKVRSQAPLFGGGKLPKSFEMKKRFIILCFFALATAVSCQQSVDLSTDGSVESGAPILSVPEGAVEGQILVKFKSSAEESLSEIGTGVVTRSGLSSVDRALDAVLANSISRVFPYDERREEVTKSSGMHLWYVINFDESQSLTEVAKQIAQIGEVEKVEYLHTLKYADRPTAVAAESSSNIVTRATTIVNDPLYSAQWGLNNDGETLDTGYGASIAGADISAEAAWERYSRTAGASSEQIIVAVMDEGVDFTHEDLKNRMWVNEGEGFNQRTDADGNGYQDDVHGYNFVLGEGYLSAAKSGDTGHGTHVAGIVAAENNNSLGVASIAGSSENVKIMSLQIFSGYYGASTVEQAMAVKYAADNGAVVLQCSWGLNSSEASLMIGPSFVATDDDYVAYFGILKEAFDYFIENAQSPNGTVDGGVVVFSAGNEEAPLPGYPSNYPDYICVTAVAADYTPAL